MGVALLCGLRIQRQLKIEVQFVFVLQLAVGRKGLSVDEFRRGT
jgi:hypothetical protein